MLKLATSRIFIISIALLALGAGTALGWTPLPVQDDPLVRMPGTQPNQTTLEAPGRCMNCHAGYNTAVEPGFNWKGSMMAQAARDFLFYACFTVAAQDSIWAVGRPNATDICMRCHFPQGWLEGRSDPTNASLMTGADFDGVQCDFCHTAWNPFFKATHDGTKEGSDWLHYWDETNASATPSQPAADATYAEDTILSEIIRLFNGGNFFTSLLPPANYTENGAGQYFISTGSQKRASFADAAARHQMLYSRYHKSRYFCATCHDVSNPLFANLGADTAQPLPSELNSASSYIHVERTFSEFMLSDYGVQGGAPGIGPFAPKTADNPAGFETSYPNNHIAKCQDCHMRDVVGVACDKNGVPIRPDESIEHPASGQPLHDMTGGNMWVSSVLASAIPSASNYDLVNDQLLNQGPDVLTLDLTQGEGIDPAALLAGADRARQQLLLAAAIENVAYDANQQVLSFRVQNQTGHKLISGFPEGRRMFVNVRAYAGNSLVYEVNPYEGDDTGEENGAHTLKGLSYPSSPPLGPNEVYKDELVYEIHPSSTLTGETKTFHFALADGRYKDNRIPPKGFRIAEAAARISQPVWHGADAPGYFTPAEYAGGYDDVSLSIPVNADYFEIRLFYQTTSREYIEFLRDEITGNATTLTDPAYLIQTDDFFIRLRAWGDTIWQLWDHNKLLPGAAPFLMTQATFGTPALPCMAPVPTLISAVPGNGEVVLTWTDESADPNLLGYKLYYDQAGKAQLIAEITDTAVTGFPDTGLTNGVEYCYKVTSFYADCESDYSNILCGVPKEAGQTATAGVDLLETGRYETVKTGKTTTTRFVTDSLFNAGDTVVVRAHIRDVNTGLPVANAAVTLIISGPETLSLLAEDPDGDGIAEASWATVKGRGKTPGTTPGSYTATVTGVTVSGYTWDMVTTSVTFTVQ